MYNSIYIGYLCGITGVVNREPDSRTNSLSTWKPQATPNQLYTLQRKAAVIILAEGYSADRLDHHKLGWWET